MALIYKDRVKETTSTTGTGAYALGGAVVSFRAFSAIGDGNTCYYAITDGTNWEVGLGTYTLAGTTLARTTILASSNADAAVNWGAGTKTIWNDVPASAFGLFGSDPLYQKYAGAGLTYTMPGIPTSNNCLTVIVGGVPQPKDGTAYTWSGTTLTLSEDPGTDVVEVWIIQATGIGVPATGVITETMLKSSAIPAIRGALQTDLLSGVRNKIINGDFDIWQRGASFTPTNNGYSADRWTTLFDGTGSTRSITRQVHTPGQTNVPGNPKYFLRYAQSVAGSGGTYSTISQHMEGVGKLSGKTVTITCYIKASAALTVPFLALFQNFGSGGSPSTRVFVSVASNLAITTSWQKFTFAVAVPSLSGKTLGTDGNDSLQFDLSLPTNATFTLDVSHISIVEGDATKEDDPFSQRHIAQELLLCQRYFFKTMSPPLAPANNLGYGSGEIRWPVLTSGANYYNWQIFWPVLMRRIPTITFYGPGDASAFPYVVGLAPCTDKGAFATNEAGSAIFAQTPSSASLNQTIAAHLTADAEF